MTRLSRRRDERGSLAPAVPVIAMMLLLLGGLGIDGSRQLNSRGQAVAFAEEASRAGAQGVDVTADDLVLDERQVSQRVADYCAQVRRDNPAVIECRWVRPLLPVSSTDRRRLIVRTFVKTQIEPTLLGMVHPAAFTASAFANARPFEGIDVAED